MIYSRINFQIYHTALFTTVNMYVTFSIYIYFITGTLYLLIIFSSHAVQLKLTKC